MFIKLSNSSFPTFCFFHLIFNIEPFLFKEKNIIRSLNLSLSCLFLNHSFDHLEGYVLANKASFALKQNVTLTLVLLNPDMSCLYKWCRSRSVGFFRSGSTLFAIKYVNLYQQSGSSNLIGWKLEIGMASCLFVLRFYGPINPMGSCRARSVYLTTRLLGRLSPLSG